MQSFNVGSKEANLRLDKYLALELEQVLSRSAVQRLIEEGKVTVGGRIQKASYKVQTGDSIEVEIPPRPVYEITAEKLPLKIYFQKETVERWRQENEAQRAELSALQNEFGFLVFTILRRTPRFDRLGSSNFTVGGIPIAPEKQLDTLVTTDLIADAMYDVYDIAFLISEDSDFCPAVEFVQEMRNKHVVHVGFGTHSNDLRAKCRLRIDLAGKDQLYRRMQAKPAKEGGGPPQ